MELIRVSAVQYKLEKIDSFEQFADRIHFHIMTAAEYGAHFVLFPEFLTTQLLSIGDEHGNGLPFASLPDFTDQYVALFSRLAIEYSIHIIGGTHVVRRDDQLYNAAFLFYPDGTVAIQPKIHVTPIEKTEWLLSQGNEAFVWNTVHGKIAILTCYDIEFPEIVRMVRAKGADIIFCPSCTDDRQGFYRVRYCCHARTIENQIYVVTTGTIGSLPNVDFMRLNFGQAAVLAPNDIPFPPAGIINEGIINDEMLIVADLNLALLEKVRAHGSVTTWRDRRTDLYTDWRPQ